MKNMIRLISLLAGIILAVCYFTHAHAAFVARSGGFGGGRISVAPRAYSAPRATYSAPRATYSAPRTVYRSNTTVIHSSPAVVHHDSGHGFFSGMLFGSLMSHPAPVMAQPIITAPVQGYAAAPMVAQSNLVDQSGYAIPQVSSFEWFIFACLLVFIGVPLIIYVLRKI